MMTTYEVDSQIDVDPIFEIETQTRMLPRYNVVLLDDNDHSYEYVIRMLKQLFGSNAPADSSWQKN